MFRGKESSNRIEISRLVQDLLNFGVLGSLWLWGGGQVSGGCLEASGDMGVSPHACTCTHTHANACKCIYRNCKWLPTWKHPCLSCLSCLTCMCVCMHVCMHACVHGTLPTHPYPTPPPCTHLPPPRGDHQNRSNFNNT